MNLSDDFSNYLSKGFDETVHNMILDRRTRMEFFKLVDEEIEAYITATCGECEYYRRYNQ